MPLSLHFALRLGKSLPLTKVETVSFRGKEGYSLPLAVWLAPETRCISLKADSSSKGSYEGYEDKGSYVFGLPEALILSEVLNFRIRPSERPVGALPFRALARLDLSGTQPTNDALGALRRCIAFHPVP